MLRELKPKERDCFAAHWVKVFGIQGRYHFFGSKINGRIGGHPFFGWPVQQHLPPLASPYKTEVNSSMKKGLCLKDILNYFQGRTLKRWIRFKILWKEHPASVLTNEEFTHQYLKAQLISGAPVFRYPDVDANLWAELLISAHHKKGIPLSL